MTSNFKSPRFVFYGGKGGAGKTTLLKLLTREERPTSGKIIIGGIDYDKLKDRDIPLLRRKIGVVFQDFKLLPNKNVFENVAFALEIVGVSSREIKHTVPKVLEIVNLKGKEKRMPRELSGGERQRVAIARALVNNPSILLADEPTGNLDSKTGAEIMNLFDRLHQTGNTIVLVTHEADVAACAHRTLHLRDGVVEQDVTRAVVTL